MRTAKAIFFRKGLFDAGKRVCTRGFTIVELLVVITIIGLLTSIVLTSLQDSRERAQATQILSDFREMEKAFFLLVDDEDVSDWWCTNGGTALVNCAGAIDTDNIPISELVNDSPGYGDYLRAVPVPPVGVRYEYDNDDGATFVCGGDQRLGVNVIAVGAGESLANKLDSVLDDGDGADCGSINWLNGNIYYKLGNDTRDF